MGRPQTRLHPRTIAACAGALVLASFGTAWASGGDLDPGFGTGGIVQQQFDARASPASTIAATAIQGDGKIVAVGFTRGAGGQAFVARFNPDGSLDTSFNRGTGVDVQQFGAGYTDSSGNPGAAQSAATGVAIQRDGNIIVAGTATQAGTQASGRAPPHRLFVARLFGGNGANAGLLDTSYGGTGFVTIQPVPRSNDDTGATAVALVPDAGTPTRDDAVAAGRTTVAATGEQRAVLVRLGLTGTPVSTFGTNGVVDAQYSGAPTPQSAFQSIVATPAGLVAAGTANTNEVLLTRYGTATGTLDPAFGGGSAMVRQYGDDPTPASGATSVLTDGLGRIYVGGFGTDGTNEWMLAARFLPDGTPDGTWGGDGVRNDRRVQWPSSAGTATVEAMDFASDGDLLLGGTLFTRGANGVALAALQPTGALDGCVGEGGLTATPLAGGGVSALSVDPGSGRAIVGGSATLGAGEGALLAGYRAPGPCPATTPSGPAVTAPSIGGIPGPLTTFAGATLAPGRSIRLLGDGRVDVPITCPITAPGGVCTGRVTITLAGSPSGSARASGAAGKDKPVRKPRPKPPPLVLGSASYSIRAGQTRDVLVQLTRTARLLLVQRPRLDCVVSVTTRELANRTVTSSKRITLSASGSVRRGLIRGLQRPLRPRVGF